jgi:putative acetyltransferase
MTLRPIQPADNAAVAQVIRTVMTEFGAVGAGYSIEDPEVDAMFEAYNNPQSAYYVVENEQLEVVGCGGIAPLRGGTADVCELKKMYFLPAARGHGMGRQLMTTLENAARERGFGTIYLETVARMESANHLYRRSGFELLPGKMGDTGHSSCGLFYAKKLSI